MPDTIVESAAQIDNLKVAVVSSTNSGVTVVTPIGDFTGTGAGTAPFQSTPQARLGQ